MKRGQAFLARCGAIPEASDAGLHIRCGTTDLAAVQQSQQGHYMCVHDTRQAQLVWCVCVCTRMSVARELQYTQALMTLMFL